MKWKREGGGSRSGGIISDTVIREGVVEND